MSRSEHDILAAMRAQMEKFEYAHTSFFTSQAGEELADDLVAHAPKGIGHVFYVSGGSEAMYSLPAWSRMVMPFAETAVG